jgi:succinylarginine dihydrolase
LACERLRASATQDARAAANAAILLQREKTKRKAIAYWSFNFMQVR